MDKAISPLPFAADSDYDIQDSQGYLVAKLDCFELEDRKQAAAFIVTACNAFDAMRAALEALAKSDHFWLLTPELIAQVRNALKGIT